MSFQMSIHRLCPQLYRCLATNAEKGHQRKNRLLRFLIAKDQNEDGRPGIDQRSRQIGSDSCT